MKDFATRLFFSFKKQLLWVFFVNSRGGNLVSWFALFHLWVGSGLGCFGYPVLELWVQVVSNLRMLSGVGSKVVSVQALWHVDWGCLDSGAILGCSLLGF